MDGVEINDRTEMFDMHGDIPDVYPPGHAYIIGEHEPEFSVLEHVVSCVTRRGTRYFCVCGACASLWEEKIRERIDAGTEEIQMVSPVKIEDLLWSWEKKDDPNPPWKNRIPPGAGPAIRMVICDDPKDLAQDIAVQYLGRFQPRCYVMYDDREMAHAIKTKVDAYVAEYRARIFDTLEKIGTFEFGYFKKDYVVSIGNNDVMHGQLAHEVTCDSLEEALDLPVFNDWSLMHLWCRLQGVVGHRMKALSGLDSQLL